MTSSDEQHPPDDLHDDVDEGAEVQRTEHDGDERDEREGDQDEDDRAEGQHERGATALDEAARLLLVVGDVDRRHEVADTAGRSPQRQDDREDQGEAERATAGRSYGGELVADQRLGLLGQRREQALALVRDGLGVRDQAEEADAGDERRKERDETEVGDAACHDPDVVLGALLERPTGHLPPAPRRDLGGHLGLVTRAGPVPGRGRRGVGRRIRSARRTAARCSAVGGRHRPSPVRVGPGTALTGALTALAQRGQPDQCPGERLRPGHAVRALRGGLLTGTGRGG